MPEIGGLNVQVNQNLNQSAVNANAGGTGQVREGQAVQQVPQGLPRLRTGSLVEGQVLAQNNDGTYTVRIDVRGMPQELRARATLSLIVGERFRAVWDASGGDGVPVLRLSQGELSFLSEISPRDRGLATALLSRGLSLSSEALAAVRDAWRRMGGQEGQLSSIVELWARGVPMTAENAALLSEYAALSGAEATELWDRIRKELKERSRKGENPLSALKSMKEGGGDTARFLQAQSILMRAPWEEINPALLAAPYWPLPGGGAGDMTARVFVGRSAEEDGQRYWQVGFGLDGSALGSVGGLVESDGRACNLNISAEREDTCELMESRRGEIRAALDGSALPVQFIGITRRGTVERLRSRLLEGRGLDVTV